MKENKLKHTTLGMKIVERVTINKYESADHDMHHP